MEDKSVFEHLEIWGQPRAWTDELIASWTIDFIEEQYGQSLCFADCLSSQWSSSVLLRAWLKGIIWAPMAPDVTSFLQEPDTHEHAPLKAVIREVKAELHFELETEWKEASKHTPGLKYPNCWGPYECLYLVGKALERFKKKFPNVPLEGLQAVQMLRVRPTIEGRLEIVTGREPWSHKTTPSRGISMKLQETRDEIIEAWHENIPPVPDWALLDGEAFFQADIAPPERPADEDLVFELGLRPPRALRASEDHASAARVEAQQFEFPREHAKASAPPSSKPQEQVGREVQAPIKPPVHREVAPASEREEWPG